MGVQQRAKNGGGAAVHLPQAWPTPTPTPTPTRGSAPTASQVRERRGPLSLRTKQEYLTSEKSGCPLKGPDDSEAFTFTLNVFDIQLINSPTMQ